MINLGFVILAHENVFRLRQVVSFIAQQNAPVAVHLDSKMSEKSREALEYFFQNHSHVHFVPSQPCSWGSWSIVDAQIRSTKLLLEKHSELDYVYHISGSCLPLRPIKEMRQELSSGDKRPDYIESVIIGERNWVVNGLQEERLTLYHPFNWQTQRKIFDAWVSLQRLLKIRRRIPKGLIPSFGSEWWCLSKGTLQKIFNDPEFDNYCKFFKSTWIPDESFFQTLTRKHSANIRSRSLTHATFDAQGKPYLMYDDHLPILERLDAFFTRKIWRGADQLYRHFLDPSRKIMERDQYAELELSALLEHARSSSEARRHGLLSQFVDPNKTNGMETRTSYHALVGFDKVKTQIYEHYIDSPTRSQLGYLFHPNRTEFEIDANGKPRNAPHLHKFRDYNKPQFLTQRIWNSYPKNISFLAKPHHLKNLADKMLRDENCNLIFIQGAWLFDIFDRKLQNIERLRVMSKIEMRREAMLRKAILDEYRKANVSEFTIADLMVNPEKIAEQFPDQFTMIAPKLNLSKFKAFLELLVANGVSLSAYDIDRVLDLNAGNNNKNSENIISIEQHVRKKQA